MVFMVQECKVTVLGDYGIELTNKVIDKFRDMGLLYGVVPVAGLYPEANITIVDSSGKEHYREYYSPRWGNIYNAIDSAELFRLFQLYGLDCPVEAVFPFHPPKSKIII